MTVEEVELDGIRVDTKWLVQFLVKYNYSFLLAAIFAIIATILLGR
jgi:hypothetical protein